VAVVGRAADSGRVIIAGDANMSKWMTLVLACVVAIAVGTAYGQDAQKKGEKKGERKGGERPTAEQIFERLDTNHDKALSPEEFKASRFLKDNPRADEIVKKVFGDKKTLTLDEFKSAMEKMRGEREKSGKGKGGERRGGGKKK
jgi:hypothetical protein